MTKKLEGWQAEQLVEQIQGGAVFVYPTDTLYGVGCSIKSPAAIDSVYRIKGRNESKPVPVLATYRQARDLAEFSDVEVNAAEKFWPGNLTLVLEANRPGELDNRLVQDGRVALRVPDLRPLLDLLDETGPIVGTSANLSGETPPTLVEDVSPFLLREVNFVLGEVEGSGEPSTVAGWDREEGWKIFRRGELPPAKLEGLN